MSQPFGQKSRKSRGDRPDMHHSPTSQADLEEAERLALQGGGEDDFDPSSKLEEPSHHEKEDEIKEDEVIEHKDIDGGVHDDGKSTRSSITARHEEDAHIETHIIRSHLATEDHEVDGGGLVGRKSKGDEEDQMSHLQDDVETDEKVKDEEKGGDKEPKRNVGSDEWEVVWQPGDIEHPLNWSPKYRWMLTLFGSLMAVNATFSSSAPSQNTPSVMAYFGFSQEVGSLLVSLFVCGYMAGPLLWGPGSEIFGRRIIFIVSFIPYTITNIGCALSRNTGTILVLRFLGGVFGASPLTNAGAVLADIWGPRERGIAVSIFSLAPFAGPALGPSVSGFIEQTGTSWRITYWTLFAFAGAVSVILVFFQPETYPPVLLAKKAARLRRETGDNRYWAAHEKQKRTWKTLLRNSFWNPFVMLVEEPMLLAITLYMSFVYGVLYLCFEAYPFIFAEIYHFRPGFVGLTFLSIFVGGSMGNLSYMVFFYPRYVKLISQHAPKPVPPEHRLPQALISGCILPISLFWLAWTCYESISYWSSILASSLLGCAIVMNMLSLFSYMIDAYLWKAATALAASTVIRSCFGAGFPLFANQMYNKLGVHWATCTLAFIALAGAPIPFILARFGPALRAKSKNAPTNF